MASLVSFLQNIVPLLTHEQTPPRLRIYTTCKLHLQKSLIDAWTAVMTTCGGMTKAMKHAYSLDRTELIGIDKFSNKR